MDARSFCGFLASRLQEAKGPLESNILNIVSGDFDKNPAMLYRLAGYRDMLTEVLGKLEPLLNDFYSQQNHVATSALSGEHE